MSMSEAATIDTIPAGKPVAASQGSAWMYALVECQLRIMAQALIGHSQCVMSSLHVQQRCDCR